MTHVHARLELLVYLNVHASPPCPLEHADAVAQRDEALEDARRPCGPEIDAHFQSLGRWLEQCFVP